MTSLDEMELPVITREPTPEERIRAAKTPEEVGFVLIALAGKGLGFAEIVEAVVDGKIEDSSLPEGTNRAEVKRGLVTLLSGFGNLLRR